MNEKIIQVISMNNYKIYKQKIEAKLESVRADIDKLKSRAKERSADSMILVNDMLKDAELKKKDLQDKLKALSDKGEEALADSKIRIDETWERLNNSIVQIKNKLK